MCRAWRLQKAARPAPSSRNTPYGSASARVAIAVIVAAVHCQFIVMAPLRSAGQAMTTKLLPRGRRGHTSKGVDAGGGPLPSVDGQSAVQHQGLSRDVRGGGTGEVAHG